jgi:hypothetical protein
MYGHRKETGSRCGEKKTSPHQNLDQRFNEINSRYHRPIGENVPEDRSGKGKIIISP